MDFNILDKIVQETLGAMEKAKEQIFSIAEDARSECARVKEELQEIRDKTYHVIEMVDEFYSRERKARVRLMEVSRGLERYTEDDIRKAYEEAQEIQVKLAVLKEREQQLRTKRDDLERRLRHLQAMVERAEQLMSQMGLILNFIGGNLKEITGKLEEAQLRQEIALRVIMAQEEERRRVAREIHDGPAQVMSSIVLQSELCERLMDIAPERVREELQELKNLVKGNLIEVRKIIYDLRPMALEEVGLYGAIEKYLDDFAEKHNVIVEHRFLGKEKRLSTLYEVAVFRMTQEALSNVAKHARAKTVKVQVEMAEAAMTTLIRDDGVGFDVQNAEQDEHFGLLGMRERAALLGGSVEIRSNLGQGTTVMIRIPLKERKDDGEQNGKDSNLASR
ncbi:sensor histidine kinase [Heliorestis convoluta]|uniref:histidine kinase n=1 Tax=Heliorestis convoluta TaxID=356322 RepID=A0A5Q2MXK8_9FIRM|nr:sensor histidine kinase [Heliorestis convoluta]QGG47474.1 DegS sensor signal transduction histidine kinase/phosphatase [Heliorestis convoluta]